MKPLIALYLCLLAWLIMAGPAGAQRVLYVSDRMQITVRLEPSGDARILEMIASGEPASFLEENNEGWFKIRTHSGKEGWVLKRHMMENKPAVVLLKEIAPQDKTVAQHTEGLRRESAEAKRALTVLEERSQECESSQAKLQRDCAEVIKLREDHTHLLEDCQQKALALERMTTENESLRFGTNIKWFLAGGGVLLLGWVMGAAFSRRKRRWSSNLE
ncbi:SH3 domain protein [Desulfarculales bacterium]